MRILFVAWRDLANPLAGGSEILVDRLAGGLVERGHDVALLCAGPAERRAYRVVTNGGKHSQYLMAPLAYLKGFRDRDLVVDVANGMAFYTPAWRRGPSLCFVNHVHTDQWAQWFPKPVAVVGREMERRLMPLAYRNRLFVAVSPSTAEALHQLGVPPEQVRIVINGVEPPAVIAPESPEPLFLALGRLVPHKRFDLLLRLWEQVRPVTGGRLVIAGDGPARRDLAAAAGEGVEILGKVDDETKERLLGEAWLLLHPAMHEGWGLVITEAASARTPTIGFRAPGVRDSVVDGVTGALVDTEDQFLERWLALAADHAVRAELGAAAQRRAERFTWSATVDRFVEVAHEAIARHHAPAAASRPARPPTSIPPRASSPPLSIVVPAFNEARRLPWSLPTLADLVRAEQAELIVVDDGSTDGTADVATRLLRGLPGASVVSLPRHRGKGAAVRSGVARASGSVIAYMDADLAADVEGLPRLVAALDGAHVSVGSRTAPGSVVTGMDMRRVALERGFNALTRALTDLRIHDTQCGFKAFRAGAAKLLFHLSQEDGLAFDVELLTLAERIGYAVAEVPVRWEAVRGSHIRIPADSVAMARTVARIWLKARPPGVLASIVARCRSDRATGDELAAGLRVHLDAAAPVVSLPTGAMALLPFVTPADSGEIAADLAARLPDVDVRPAVLAANELFDPAAAQLRAALAIA
jgi:glycosyltransferase involved in cell wall biosynthesis